MQTTEKEVMRKEKHVEEEASADEEVIYKIDVPANRYVVLVNLEKCGSCCCSAFEWEDWESEEWCGDFD